MSLNHNFAKKSRQAGRCDSQKIGNPLCTQYLQHRNFDCSYCMPLPTCSHFRYCFHLVLTQMIVTKKGI